MSEIKSVSQRIDEELAAAAKKVKDEQVERLREYREYRGRLRQLDGVFQKLTEGWRPRLETLLQKFGDRVQVTPRQTLSSRETAFEFRSKLGHVSLRFSAAADRDITKLVLRYDLEMSPVSFRYEPHAELELPLGAIDEEAAGRWVDDRIIDFVRAYLSLTENELFVHNRLVEDPVAHVQFPDFAAGATLEWQGKMYYFIGEETREEFARQNGIALG